MTATHLPLPGIVCGPGRKPQRCGCGASATILCDWRLPVRRNSHDTGTCDAPLCARCATSPAAGKHLCSRHAADWRLRLGSGTCFACSATSPFIWRGTRYCADHYPDPGPHIRRSA